jgi:hypothetical protein
MYVNPIVIVLMQVDNISIIFAFAHLIMNAPLTIAITIYVNLLVSKHNHMDSITTHAIAL